MALDRMRTSVGDPRWRTVTLTHQGHLIDKHKCVATGEILYSMAPLPDFAGKIKMHGGKFTRILQIDSSLPLRF